jgi:RNA polymerase sigma-70 factor, ECF subfamily
MRNKDRVARPSGSIARLPRRLSRLGENRYNSNNISQACHGVPRKGYSPALYSTRSRSASAGRGEVKTRKVMSMSDFARLLQNEILGCGDMLGPSLGTRREPPGTDLRAWLFTILHNQDVNEIRRSVREGVVVAVEDVAPVLTVAPRAASSLQLRDLERAIRLLPEEQRQVILLVGLEGMRYEEVAAVLDIPIGTVRSRLSRSRKMLRRLMDIKEESDVAFDHPNRLRNSDYPRKAA